MTTVIDSQSEPQAERQPCNADPSVYKGYLYCILRSLASDSCAVQQLQQLLAASSQAFLYKPGRCYE